ncbi:Golgi membrane protein 1 isoform X2 [Pelodiscus sinensis]|uniref:Golgi membrane protein 1 isoform X2 n=1 Tax=Pelodiscus sinensis TaxID=13735 RepID=UPI000703CD9B|nr:Golgi membrane protein 1 isoform X2 [Pelodiscus sinensis]|eukprot:XP_014435401.1 Golgi membrane protein 1 isoform X2 [Pelodiscus sinensis]
MVGLGNGRRGMKSPPLLIAALVACMIVLGFNYWIASSRNVDLQSRIMELERKVRRAAAERGAVELKKNEFQGELEKQREQIDKIQSLHGFQLENVNKMHQDEKAVLMNNITTNERFIQNLKEHLIKLQNEYGKLQQDVNQFQKNQTNLQKKFSYEMSQCINQMKELKEQCEEKIHEITKKDSEAPQAKDIKDLLKNSNKNDQDNIQLSTSNRPELQLHDLEAEKGDEEQKEDKIPGNESLEISKPTFSVKKEPKIESHGDKEGMLDLDVVNQKDLIKDEKLSVDQGPPHDSAKSVMDHEELPPKPGKEPNPYEGVNVLKEGDTQRESVEMQEPSAGHAVNQEHFPNEEIEREHLLNYDAQPDDQEPSQDDKQRAEAVNQNNVAVDYNLDENEAESETDKQAALADNDFPKF